ncbi:hypothetical protein HMPREF3032_00331 [Veillonella sp. DNF00869]|nr:hypothetical protein HMPREF3032_00331 [Veillonella sp. DNF00869]
MIRHTEDIQQDVLFCAFIGWYIVYEYAWKVYLSGCTRGTE